MLIISSEKTSPATATGQILARIEVTRQRFSQMEETRKRLSTRGVDLRPLDQAFNTLGCVTNCGEIVRYFKLFSELIQGRPAAEIWLEKHTGIEGAINAIYAAAGQERRLQRTDLGAIADDIKGLRVNLAIVVTSSFTMTPDAARFDELVGLLKKRGVIVTAFCAQPANIPEQIAANLDVFLSA